MEAPTQQASMSYRAFLWAIIAGAFLLSPVTVFAIMHGGKPPLPPMMEQIIEIPAEEFTKLDDECTGEVAELFGKAAKEEGPLREALSGFCSCNSNTTIVARLQAEQFFQQRLGEEGKKFQEIRTKDITVRDENYESRNVASPFNTKLPGPLVRQYSVALRNLDEERLEYYRQLYGAAMNQCVRILAPWEDRYGPVLRTYLGTRTELPRLSPPALKRAPSSRRLVHLEWE
jgi:hypothetical protein